MHDIEIICKAGDAQHYGHHKHDIKNIQTEITESVSVPVILKSV